MFGIHECEWPAVFFSCSFFVWLWCQIYTGHIKLVGKHSLFNLRESLYKTVRGNRVCDPKIRHFGMWFILSWRQSRPSRVRKNFYLSLNCLKEFRYGPMLRKRAITIDNFLSERPICMAEQISNYQISVLLTVLWSSRYPSHPLAPNSI